MCAWARLQNRSSLLPSCSMAWLYSWNTDKMVWRRMSEIGKSTGPRSSTGENSGGPMKTLIVPVLLSGKENFCREPLYEDSNVEKN